LEAFARTFVADPADHHRHAHLAAAQRAVFALDADALRDA
jgi:hypothetical protein